MKLAAVLTVILFCRPSLPQAEALGYAKIVLDGSTRLGIDPLLAVAIVDHESRWIPTAVNKKSGALGFGQILPQFRPACAKGSPSAVCSAEKKNLLDGAGNLRVMFEVIEVWQKFCKAKVGTLEATAWMTSYAGLNRPKQGEVCGRRATGAGWQQLPIHSLVKASLVRQRALRLRLESLPPG